MKHFEDIWNEAEEMSNDISSAIRIGNIEKLLIEFKKTKDVNLFGEILFELTGISKELNINVAAVLNHILDGKKIDEWE